MYRTKDFTNKQEFTGHCCEGLTIKITQMAEQELTIKKRSEGKRRKLMEATRRQRESMRDPVADIRTTSENVVAQ